MKTFPLPQKSPAFRRVSYCIRLFAGLAILMAVPYLATIYVSLREPLAEPPPDSYTSKW